jgi:hypothetical protein
MNSSSRGIEQNKQLNESLLLLKKHKRSGRKYSN